MPLDKTNQTYFDRLLDLRKNQRKLILKIGENVFPTAIAPKEMWESLPVKNYNELKKSASRFTELSRNTALWIKKTQAGGGTSVRREKYLQEVKGSQQINVGAKGTDLFVRRGQEYISLAEVQFLQAAYKIRAHEVGEVFIQDLVSPDTQAAIKNLWAKKSLISSKYSYDELSKEIKSFNHFGEVLQTFVQTIDDAGHLSNRRVAPAGHGFFAFETLLSSAHQQNAPKASCKNLLSVIGNGEDLGSTPDGIIFGWVIEEKAPITMITTEKTEIDLKGGQISFVRDGEDSFLALIEQAQAKEAGQLDLFEKIGLSLRNEKQMALFNTNVAIFNHSVLNSKLKQLVSKIGEEAFCQAITPTLIENKKTQTDDDGVTRTYIQLEGAMGSSLLNLDRAWRKHFSEPLVFFVNVEKENRTKFFSPIKTAFDFFMLFYSDRFKFDFESWQLLDQRPGFLPVISLSNDYYAEVANMLDAFADCSIRELDCLSITGSPVACNRVKLVGKIQIENKTKTIFNLAKTNQRIIKDKKIEVALDGSIKVTSL